MGILKSITIDGITNEIKFPKYLTNTVSSFNISTANTGYGGAKVTLEPGYAYILVAYCQFGTSTSTSSQAYEVWIARTSTPNNPYVGNQRNFNQYNSAPKVIATTILTPNVPMEVGAYANVVNTVLSGNSITLQALRIGVVES